MKRSLVLILIVALFSISCNKSENGPSETKTNPFEAEICLGTGSSEVPAPTSYEKGSSISFAIKTNRQSFSVISHDTGKANFGVTDGSVYYPNEDGFTVFTCSKLNIYTTEKALIKMTVKDPESEQTIALETTFSVSPEPGGLENIGYEDWNP